MHKEVAKLWIVPASDSVSKAGINSEPITRPSSAPQNINDNLAPVSVGIEDSMDVEYVEAGDEGLVTDRHGGSAWKGKKRAAAAEPPGGARQATASQVSLAELSILMFESQRCVPDGDERFEIICDLRAADCSQCFRASCSILSTCRR